MRGWLLDTNVVSEMVRPKPNGRVIGWLRSLPEERAFISILTLAEIDQGVEGLDPADDRAERYRRFRSSLEAQFSGRILALDDDTVRLWGALSGRYRRAVGGRAPVIDTMLVATTQRHRLYLATRNVAHARPLGATAFDPWSDDPAKFPLRL